MDLSGATRDLRARGAADRHSPILMNGESMGREALIAFAPFFKGQSGAAVGQTLIF
jgi:hypothetical protein